MSSYHINSEVKRLVSRAEGGNACSKLHWLRVVTEGVESQEGGVIAQAWISDPKVYPSIPMLK